MSDKVIKGIFSQTLIAMTKTINLIIGIALWSSSSFAQDLLYTGKRFTLPEVRYPLCIRYGEELAEQEFQKQYAPIFDSVAQFLQSNPKLIIEIQIHTDSRGSDSMNLALSQRKANDWYTKLIQRGLDSTRLRAIGYGETSPRTVWLKDSTYYIDESETVGATSIVLTESYINTYRRTNRELYSYLHQLNRREEIVIIAIEE